MRDNLIKMKDFDENKISAEEISSVSRIHEKLVVNLLNCLKLINKKGLIT